MSAGSMQGTKGRYRAGADLSPEEKAARKQAAEEKAAGALERLEGGLRAILTDDDRFREYLRLAGRMHSYSWGNRMLVMLQRPDTRMVAGYKRWSELGRPVKKGSKGLVILAPMQRVIRETDATTGEERKRAFLTGFRAAYVFAVEDTDGPPIDLPSPIGPDDDTPAAGAIADRLAGIGPELGCPVTVRAGEELGNGTDGRPAGWYRPDAPAIVVNLELPAAHRAKTIAHELAHHVDYTREAKGPSPDRAIREAVAEGAAFIVAAHYGIDTSAYTVPYVATWAENLSLARAVLQRMAFVADVLITAADAHGGCPVCGWDGDADGGGCEHCR